MKKIVSIKSDRGDLDSGEIGMDMIVDFSHSNLVFDMAEATKVKKTKRTDLKHKQKSSAVTDNTKRGDW